MDVYSEALNIVGKIDIYKQDEKYLIERKRTIKALFKGHYYQVYAQYFCMLEMGYTIEKIAFHSLSDNKIYPVPLPSEEDKKELIAFIGKLEQYDPSTPVKINPNKCRHCIYSNLCDQTDDTNVYE